MAEKAEQEGQVDKKTIFNSDIGDDWGEAFAAEDLPQAPTADAGNEFFLPEVEATSGIAAEDEAEPAAATEAKARGQFPLLYQSLLARFTLLPLTARLALLATPILLAALVFVFHPGRKKPTPPPKAAKTSPAAPQPSAHTPPAPPHATPAAPAQPVEPPVATKAKEHPAEEPLTLRKKWRLASVLVHAKANKGQEPILLTTDLTLTLKLPPESIPPTDKDAVLRETLHRFYTNLPPDDLRRYALERGELTAKLKTWISEQWPELPLESISIDRYQLR